MKTETTKTTTDVYKITEAGNENNRSANIIFTNEEFDTCKYELEYTSDYNFEDWMFLKEVASKIEKIQKKYNK